MGLVYRVYHRDWNLDLAVKSPRPQFFQTLQQIENFEQEAETWVNLGLHPHIASCHYVRRLGGIPRLFAEFVEEGTLSDWIRTKKLYEGSEEEVMRRIIDVAIQFAWGLNYAHEKGLVHQDVKPGNVLMSSDGVAKVSDFGLASARRTSTENTTIPTHAGQSILVPGSGFMTPEYASPEQSRGDPLSKMTDVWSWAVSILEMLLGELTWAKGIAAPAVLEGMLEDIENTRITCEFTFLLDRCFGSDSQSVSTRLNSLDYAIEFLLVYYNSRFGTYPRSKPNAAETLAVTLNNRAVSLVDLGKTEEAVKLWTRACRSDSSSVDPLYNLSLYKTRTEKGHGKLPKTLKWIDERFNTLDKSVDATLARACILAELGEYKSAQNCIARELEGIGIPDSANALLSEFAELGSPSATPSQSFSVPTSGGQYFWVDQCWKTVLRSLYLENKAHGFELLDIKSGSIICRLSHFKGFVSSASATRDCRYLATLSRDPHFENADKIMVLWDIHSESEIASFTCSSKTATPVITDSGQAIIFSDEHAIWIAVLNIDGFTISEIAQVKYPMRLQLFEDAELLLASGYDSHTSNDQNPETRLISLTSKQTILSRPTTIGMGHPRYCRSRKELICDRLTDIYAFSLEDNVVRFCLSGHRNAINAMSLSPDESLLASASNDGTVRLWDLANRSCRHVYEVSNHMNNVISVTQVDFSSDGGSLLTANAIGDISVWTIPSTKRLYSAPWHISRPMSVRQIVNNYTEFESLWSSVSDYFKQEMYFECARKLSQARSLHGKSRDSSAIELWGSLYSKIPKGSLNGFWQISQKSGNNINPWNLTEIFISETMGYCCCIGRRAGDVRLVSIPELDTILTFSKTGMEPLVIEPLLGDKIGILWGIKPIDWFEANGEFTATSIDIYSQPSHRGVEKKLRE